MVFPPSILFLLLCVLFICLSYARTNPSSLSSLPVSQSLTGQQLIKDLNLHHPKLEINIFKGYTNSSNDELKVSEFGLVEKRLSFQVLGDSGATVTDLAPHAGYFRLQHTIDARMFYFFFESRKAKADPVVIWLTGGPGCASKLALFYENGPFKLTSSLSLIWNDYGWDKVSNVIYVDQPTGTGFSYSSSDKDSRHDETGAFFKAHLDYVNNDFYITGESYAGHYISAFAARINKGNKNKEGIHINLKGRAIGNGLTNPGIQYQAYTDFPFTNNIISISDYFKINQKLPACEQAIKQCGTTGTGTCLSAYNMCNQIFLDIINLTDNINYYDIRKKCDKGPHCYNFTTVAMMDDWMRNLEVEIPALLEQHIELLVYAGEYDLICNWLCNSRWVHAMPWSGQEEFVLALNVPFLVNGEEAGIMKNHGPLTFIKVHNAGHMVPTDQPKAALNMLELWTTGKHSPPKKGVVTTL